MPTITKKRGFSLIELLIAMSVAGVLVMITVSVYSLFRKSFNFDQSRVDISQNGRVAFDRITREIRQTPAIVTKLPASEIEFEDGHANDLTYHRYYLVGTTLELDTKQYYFASDPTTRVRWNQIDGTGNPPVSSVISTQAIATSVQSLSFSGNKPLVFLMTTADTYNQIYKLRTDIFERNL